MSDSTDDLEPLVADLAETLEALERRLDAEPRRRRALLRFTEQYAIPTTVAVLEANIRVLEAVGGAIRLAEGRDPPERSRQGRETALATLDRALSEVSETVAGTPTDPEARELLSEARSLRDEIRGRVDASTAEPDEPAAAGSHDGTTIPVAEQRGSERDADAPADGVDVDAELDTIRKEVHGERGDDGGEADEDAADGDGGSDDPAE
jgi:hypothetical protein